MSVLITVVFGLSAKFSLAWTQKPYENLGMLYDIERTLYFGDVFENKFYDQRSSPFKKKFYDKRSSPLLKNYDTLKLVLTNFVCIGYQA